MQNTKGKKVKVVFENILLICIYCIADYTKAHKLVHIKEKLCHGHRFVSRNFLSYS